MAKYIKTHSNFVYKTKHQDTNNGTIFERDITTIGGIDQFSPSQTPIYRSGNFIITINNEGTYMRDVVQTYWEQNAVSGDMWTHSAIEATSQNGAINDENDTLVIPKQDYYDLRDFAYYGSCVELMRGSVNGIIQTFPGELYIPQDSEGKGIAISYQDNSPNVAADERNILFVDENDNPLYYIENPFDVDMHTNAIHASTLSPLKYLCQNGYLNYEIITSGNSAEDIIGWESTPEEFQDGQTRFCPGDKIATIKLQGSEQNNYTIYAYIGNQHLVYYLLDEDNFAKLKGKHIRPKHSFFTQFYNSLSTFQKLLLNVNSTPKYKATFRIINDNDYGYYTEMKSFTFPIAGGGYNLSTNPTDYDAYLTPLVDIGQYYDDLFTDNLWRSMTHESIKNFDWSFKREYNDNDADDYIEGGNKIEKMIHLYGKIFDDCKVFIDSIQNTNTLTYNDRNNLPNYFLTDTVNADGWDYHSVYPFKYNDTTTGFSRTLDGAVVPYLPLEDNQYGNWQYGYFPSSGNCNSDTICNIEWETQTVSSKTQYDTNRQQIIHLIKPYTSNKSYSFKEINNVFLKNLKLNSRHILRHKGTIEGIEMVLALFGLKSKRWAEKLKTTLVCASAEELDYDYEITEYTSFIDKPIVETWDAVHNDYRINWVNTTKLISYRNQTSSLANSDPYLGLPISYRDLNGKNNYIKTDGIEVKDKDGNHKPCRYLYPYFNPSDQLDGNPYYQMKGGWGRKIYDGQCFQFDKDFNLVKASDNTLYHETLRNVRCVSNLISLLNVDRTTLYDGVIYYVYDLQMSICTIDGTVYRVYQDVASLSNEDCAGYVDFVVYNETITIANEDYSETVDFYDSEGSAYTYHLNSFADGSHIKAYIFPKKYFPFYAESKETARILSFSLFSYNSENNMTHYFYLNKVEYCDKLITENDENGWKQLSQYDNELNIANTSQDYYEGNNPHNGNSQYDSGYAYMNYFGRIFNYALDNNLFNLVCYQNDEVHDIDTVIPKYGFSGLTTNNNQVKDREDTKIHYFGHFRTPSLTTDFNRIDAALDLELEDITTSGYPLSTSIYVYSDEVDTYPDLTFSERYGQMYSASTKVDYLKTYSMQQVSDGIYSGGCRFHTDGTALGINDYGYANASGRSDQTTNQIVNNKHLQLKFYMPSPSYEDNPENPTSISIKKELLAYYDNVILPYAEQMIPSNAILDVVYTHLPKDYYTITFYFHDGSKSKTPTIYIAYIRKGNAIGSLSLPKPNMDEQKYNLPPTWDNGLTLSDIQKIVPTSDMTFHAKYTIKTYTVTFKNIDGSGKEEKRTYEYGTALTTANYPLTDNDTTHEFLYWDKTSVKVTSDTEITAIWKTAGSFVYTLQLNDAVSEPTVKMGNKTLNVSQKPDGTYVATSAITTTQATKPITVSVSGGLPSPKYAYEINSNPPSIQIRKDEQQYDITVTGTIVTTTYSWEKTTVTIKPNTTEVVDIASTSITNSNPDIGVKANSNPKVTVTTSTAPNQYSATISNVFKNTWVQFYLEDNNNTSATVQFIADTQSYCYITWMKTNTIQYTKSSVLETEQITQPSPNPTRNDAVFFSYSFTGWSDQVNGKILNSFPAASEPSYTYYAQWDIYYLCFNYDNDRCKTLNLTYPATATTVSDIQVLSQLNSKWQNCTVKYGGNIKGVTCSVSQSGVLNASFPENTDTSSKEFTFVITQQGSNRTLTLNITQYAKDITLLTCDYLELRYNWGEGGKDLDTATMLVTPSISVADNAPAGINCPNNSPYIVFGGDNHESGNECALVKVKEIKAYIEAKYGTTPTGRAQWMQDNLKYDKTIQDYYAEIDVYGNWFVSGSSATQVTMQVTTSKGGTEEPIFRDDFTIDFGDNATTKMVTSLNVSVNAQSFANEQQEGARWWKAENTNQITSAYTKIAEVRYFVTKNNLRLITNKQDECDFKDKIGAHVDKFEFKTISSDYWTDCTMLRSHLRLYYTNVLTSRCSFFPQDGCQAQCALDISVNGKSVGVTIDTPTEYRQQKEYLETITFNIASNDKTNEYGQTSTTAAHGYITEYPWISFVIGNNNTSTTTDSAGLQCGFSQYMTSVCGKSAQLYQIKIYPDNQSYILLDKDGKQKRYMHATNDNDYVPSQWSNYTEGCVLYTNDANAACEMVKLSIDQTEKTLFFTPSELKSVDYAGTQCILSAPANTENKWRQWRFNIQAIDSNFSTDTIKYGGPYVVQESENPLQIFLDENKTNEITSAKQLWDANQNITSVAYYVHTLKLSLSSEGRKNSVDFWIYFNRNVKLDNYNPSTMSKILNGDYSTAVSGLHFKCNTNYDSSNCDWEFTCQDQTYGYAIKVIVSQASK